MRILLLVLMSVVFIGCNSSSFTIDSGKIAGPTHPCAPKTLVHTPSNASSLSLIYGTNNLGNSHSAWPSFASTNKVVAFGSLAANLVNYVVAPAQQAFYYNFETLTLELASKDANGVVSNGASWMAKSDCTGRYIVFVSLGTNLTSDVVTGTFYQTFLKDTETGEVKLVSSTSAGVPADSTSGWDAIFPVVSYDGRYVGFSSKASNLVTPAPPAGIRQIYRKDLQTGEVILVSSDEAGTAATAHIGYFDMTPDGNSFAWASNLAIFPDSNGSNQVYVKNITKNKVTTISKYNGTAGNAGTMTGNFSADGKYLGILSNATNLTSDPAFSHGPAGSSIFRVRLSDGRIEYAGQGTSACCSRPPIPSFDGKYLVWLSNQPVDGQSTGQSQVVVKNMVTGALKLVSKNSSGVLLDSRAEIPTLSGDGKFVVFQGFATNYYPGDPNGAGAFQAYFNLTGF